MQHNLYDVPVREFERIRELTCGAVPEEQISLMDKGMSATESHDSIKLKKKSGQASKRSNPFTLVFSELVDVLECGPGLEKMPTGSTTKKFEEEKIEMLGSRA